jgi:hypothetical protein
MRPVMSSMCCCCCGCCVLGWASRTGVTVQSFWGATPANTPPHAVLCTIQAEIVDETDQYEDNLQTVQATPQVSMGRGGRRSGCAGRRSKEAGGCVWYSPASLLLCEGARGSECGRAMHITNNSYLIPVLPPLPSNCRCP